MNFLDIKAGDSIEIGTQKAWRFWRYKLPDDVAIEIGTQKVLPGDNSVRLLSWIFPMRWRPGRLVESTSPDQGLQGIHGFRTMQDLLQSYSYRSDHLVMRSQASGCDGVVFGTVEMWGVIWDHERGYRAQFARPTSFISSCGDRSEQALADLRASFFGEAR